MDNLRCIIKGHEHLLDEPAAFISLQKNNVLLVHCAECKGVFRFAFRSTGAGYFEASFIGKAKGFEDDLAQDS